MNCKNIILSIGVACICFHSAFAQTTVKISGSVPFKDQYFDEGLDAIKAKTKLNIEVVANGSDRGVADVIDGRSDAAMLSSHIADIAKTMNEKKPGSVDVSKFKESKIGDCEIVLTVHPSNSVKTLTSAQAVGLLSGTIQNWKEVGGSDLPVVIVVAMPGNGIRTTTEKVLMKKTPISSTARQVTNPAQVADVVAQMPGAIGPLGLSMLENKKVSALHLSDTKIIAPMLIATLGEPSTDVSAIIEALKSVKK